MGDRETAADVVSAACLSIGLPRGEKERACAALTQAYISHAWQLEHIDTAGWKELGIPLGVSAAVRRHLSTLAADAVEQRAQPERRSVCSIRVGAPADTDAARAQKRSRELDGSRDLRTQPGLARDKYGMARCESNAMATVLSNDNLLHHVLRMVGEIPQFLGRDGIAARALVLEAYELSRSGTAHSRLVCRRWRDTGLMPMANSIVQTHILRMERVSEFFVAYLAKAAQKRSRESAEEFDQIRLSSESAWLRLNYEHGFDRVCMPRRPERVCKWLSWLRRREITRPFMVLTRAASVHRWVTAFARLPSETVITLSDPADRLADSALAALFSSPAATLIASYELLANDPDLEALLLKKTPNIAARKTPKFGHIGYADGPSLGEVQGIWLWSLQVHRLRRGPVDLAAAGFRQFPRRDAEETA